MYRVYLIYMGRFLDYTTYCDLNAFTKAEMTGLSCIVFKDEKAVAYWSPIKGWRHEPTTY